MAKKSKINVNGLSINDILNMDWEDVSKLSRSELAKITSRLVSASNKRVKRLEQSNLGESPALRGLKARENGQTRLSVKGKTHGQIEHTFITAKNFLSMKSSSISGYKKTIKNIRKSVSERIGKDVSDLDISKLYSTLHKAQEMGLVDGRGSKGSEYAVSQITDILENNPDKSIDDIIDDINDWYSNMYEEDESDYDEDDDAVFFDDEF